VACRADVELLIGPGRAFTDSVCSVQTNILVVSHSDIPVALLPRHPVGITFTAAVSLGLLRPVRSGPAAFCGNLGYRPTRLSFCGAY